MAKAKVKRKVPQANIIRGNAPSANAVPQSAIGSAISAGGPFNSTINSAAGAVPSANIIDPGLADQITSLEIIKASQPVLPAVQVEPVKKAKAKASVKKKKKPNMQEMADAIDAGVGKDFIKGGGNNFLGENGKPITDAQFAREEIKKKATVKKKG
jgi:hypothetical protein